jgi:quercetin dioxygenase-like cupin family protein
MQFDSTGFTPYNMTEATFNIKEGDIIIHPSNITHGFDANPTGNRITLTAQIVPVA